MRPQEHTMQHLENNMQVTASEWAAFSPFPWSNRRCQVTVRANHSDLNFVRLRVLFSTTITPFEEQIGEEIDTFVDFK